VTERAEHIAEWVKLTEEKQSKEVFGQLAQKPKQARGVFGRSRACLVGFARGRHRSRL
jgi:hypothetical protein